MEIRVNEECGGDNDKLDQNCTTYLIKTSTNSSIIEICNVNKLMNLSSMIMPNLVTISMSSNSGGCHFQILMLPCSPTEGV